MNIRFVRKGRKAFIAVIIVILFILKLSGQNNSADLNLLIRLDEGKLPYEKNGSMLGRKVANIGDVNGDGYDDWSIGVPNAVMYERPQVQGKVYIYFGGPHLSNEQDPDVILIGKDKTNPLAGEYVAAAGDVNGDGYDDILVGVEGDESGKVYIYFGGAPMDTTADVVLIGEALNDCFGASLSTAGDVNNDGYDDVIVGAYGNDVRGRDAGRAYIYFGGSRMDDSADVVLTGESIGDQFGGSVARSGDVNGDGFDDVIIGAAYAGPGSATGRAFIYFGGASMDNQEDVMLTGEASWNLFGTDVSSAGDVNNDGYDDTVILAYIRQNNYYFGQMYIFYGAAEMDGVVDIVLTSDGLDDQFGRIASSAGDVNNDGYADIMVNSDSSRIYIFYGDQMMDGTPDVVLTGENSGDKFGYSFSPAGDVNHDGYADVIVGAFRNSSGGRMAGRTYLYFGGSSMDDAADIILTGAASLNHFAASVSHAGDMNGDGYADIIIGAPANSRNGWSAGSAYIYLGGSIMSKTPDVILTGKSAGERFGASTADAGDVNNDGYDDVIIGAPRSDAAGKNSGRVYICLGGAVVDSITDVVLTGESENANFGASVSSAGDVNGDGYADVIVGAFGAGAHGEMTGRAYIFYGGAVIEDSADVLLMGEADDDKFGFSVSSAGDVNNDGYDDVVVGAFLNDRNGEDAGSAYLYFGSPHMDDTADVVFKDEMPMDLFGFSVSGAGDVNGDGYGDVIVGAYLAGHRNDGRAYLYFGGADMDDAADVVLSPPDAENTFGYSVSHAGDVNNDGFDDVIVGAPKSSGPGAFVFYGGSPMDDAADVLLTGEAARDQFGHSVSFAGDVDHDGYVELLVGAPRNSAAGMENGRAFIFSSSPAVTIKETVDRQPIRFSLGQNYPNPFNSFTTIEFTAPQSERVTIDIYDILGRKVMTLSDDQAMAGSHKVKFSAGQLASGIYFCILKSGENTLTRKLVLLQ